MLWDVNFFVTRQDKASKDTFFPTHLKFYSNLGIKISDLKKEKCHTEGGQKSAKKCHILFEWPLIECCWNWHLVKRRPWRVATECRKQFSAKPKIQFERHSYSLHPDWNKLTLKYKFPFQGLHFIENDVCSDFYYIFLNICCFYALFLSKNSA